MIKKLRDYFIHKRLERRQRRYMEGYNYARDMHRQHGHTILQYLFDVSHNPFDMSEFDLGIQDYLNNTFSGERNDALA